MDSASKPPEQKRILYEYAIIQIAKYLSGRHGRETKAPGQAWKSVRRSIEAIFPPARLHLY
jgi:hypothetical protein